MTHRRDRTLLTSGLARVEGEGAMYVRVNGDRVEEVRLEIYEPPRFFEAFLRGRSYTEPPRHHRPRLRHLPRRLPDECLPGNRRCLRAHVDGAIADLRRLLYCGEWIGSHALHIYMLHGLTSLGTRAWSRWRRSTGRSWSAASPCEAPGTRSWKYSAGAPSTR
jgi:hypothetical protein